MKRGHESHCLAREDVRVEGNFPEAGFERSVSPTFPDVAAPFSTHRTFHPRSTAQRRMPASVRSWIWSPWTAPTYRTVACAGRGPHSGMPAWNAAGSWIVHFAMSRPLSFAASILAKRGAKAKLENVVNVKMLPIANASCQLPIAFSHKRHRVHKGFVFLCVLCGCKMDFPPVPQVL